MINVHRSGVVERLARLQGPKLAVPVKTQPNGENPYGEYEYEQAELWVCGRFQLFVLTSHDTCEIRIT